MRRQEQVDDKRSCCACKQQPRALAAVRRRRCPAVKAAYRKGFNPNWFGEYDRFRYSYVNPWKADEVWRRLVKADPDMRGIEGADLIADVMGVAKGTSYRHRRMLEALDLVHIRPGVREQYPSVLTVLTTDVDAFAVLHGAVCGEDLDLYVASREHDTPAYVREVARCARGSAPPVSWLSRNGHQMVLPVLRETTSNVVRTSTRDSFAVVSPTPLHAVVLVERNSTHSLPTERSEGPTKRVPVSHIDPLTMADLMQRWDITSRATAYRHRDRKIREGTLRRVGRGLYEEILDQRPVRGERRPPEGVAGKTP